MNLFLGPQESQADIKAHLPFLKSRFVPNEKKTAIEVEHLARIDDNGCLQRMTLMS